MLGARPVSIPKAVARAALDVPWRLHLVPASPHLLDPAASGPLRKEELRTGIGDIGGVTDDGR